VRTSGLGEPADDGIDILDVVDERAVRKAEAIVDRLAVVGELRGRDDVRRVAAMLAVECAQRCDAALLLVACGRAARQPRIDEIVEAPKLFQSILPAKLVEARNAALKIALDVARGDVDIAGLAGGPARRDSAGIADDCAA
jgi:hypothetical protein